MSVCRDGAVMVPEQIVITVCCVTLYWRKGKSMSGIRSDRQDGGHVCPHKFAFILDNWVRKLLQNPGKIVGTHIGKGDTVVDMGCGPGFFTIEMAKRVGESGRVYAVDLQEEMLDHVKQKAKKHGLAQRISCHRCGPDRIGLDCRADFILAYYMIHETPDPALFFDEIKTMLADGGRLLAVEPWMHVSRGDFDHMIEVGRNAGLNLVGRPGKKGGRSALFSL